MESVSKIKNSGRSKGTPNRVTKELRLKLKDLIFNEIDYLSSNMSSLELKDRIEYIIKILPYAIPKIESVSFDLHEPFNIEDYV
jgi:hypothetical protein